MEASEIDSDTYNAAPQAAPQRPRKKNLNTKAYLRETRVAAYKENKELKARIAQFEDAQRIAQISKNSDNAFYTS